MKNRKDKESNKDWEKIMQKQKELIMRHRAIVTLRVQQGKKK